MKNLIYTLFLLPLFSVPGMSQCSTTPIQVNIFAQDLGDCIYQVAMGMNLPVSPAHLDLFSITAVFGGATSGIITECDFPNANVHCTNNSNAISLFSTNSGSSNQFNGITIAEFETDGCLTFDANNFFPEDPCIVLGIVSGFCTGQQPSGPACINFNYLADPPCEVETGTQFLVESGCSSELVGVPAGEGDVCFDTFDGECVEVSLEAGECGCVSDSPVSVTDIVLMQRHVLGLQPLSNSLPLALADVNCDGQITVLDLLTVRQHLLGIPTTVQDDCPDVGDCVMVDNTTGEIVTELCPLDQTDVSLGVFGDVNGSCDPCGNGEYEYESITSSGGSLAAKEVQGTTFLAFEQSLDLNTIILELPLKVNLDSEQVILTDDIIVDYFDKQIIDNKLHVMLFSETPFSVEKGAVLLEIKATNLDLVGQLDSDKNVLITADGGTLSMDRMAESTTDLDISTIHYSFNDDQLLLAHNLLGENINVRIVNVSGQILYEETHYNSGAPIGLEVPQNQSLFFVSMYTESEMVTKTIFH